MRARMEPGFLVTASPADWPCGLPEREAAAGARALFAPASLPNPRESR
ncbi:MAG: hypothetical protein BWX68_01541 [Verrucomicrobia bacterium ADurb.Bin063]|nr:MAG: hypothetical protein BWX68_01541 [Verrucomicrobia bacterium ADurb.Bin063]